MDHHMKYVLGDGIGYVSLIDQLGSDLSVVNAARVSYAKTSGSMTDKDVKLIRYLIAHSHGTPFEHVVFQFRVRAPLFVVHQWERHRIASYNEESARYVEMRPDFYFPAHLGQSTAITNSYRAQADDAFEQYKELLEQGEPKELARMVLGSNLYKEFWWTVNARSLMNFIELRADSHAQWEIRQYADALEEIFKSSCPAMHEAFVSNGRIAP